jgi:hypothetical protein
LSSSGRFSFLGRTLLHGVSIIIISTTPVVMGSFDGLMV